MADHKMKIPVEVEAQLCLVYKDPADGKITHRPVTDDELKALDLRDRNSMYDNTVRNIKTLGLDPERGIGSELRYLIEHSTHFDFSIEDSDEFSKLRAALLVAQDEEEDDD